MLQSIKPDNTWKAFNETHNKDDLNWENIYCEGNHVINLRDIVNPMGEVIPVGSEGVVTCRQPNGEIELTFDTKWGALLASAVASQETMAFLEDRTYLQQYAEEKAKGLDSRHGRTPPSSQQPDRISPSDQQMAEIQFVSTTQGIVQEIIDILKKAPKEPIKE